MATFTRSGARFALAAIVLLCALGPPRGAHASDANLSLWRSLDWFRGAWEGREEGMLGPGHTIRCTQDVFGGRFLLVRTRIAIDTSDAPRPLEDFETWQVFARDPDSGRITVDQYESGGYHRRFELDEATSRPDRMRFVSRDLGDAATGRAGSMILRVIRGNRYEEELRLGEDTEALQRIRRSRWSRSEKARCDAGAFRLPDPES